MPSDDLLPYFQIDPGLVDRWQVDGRHYRQTSGHWLHNKDPHRAEITPILAGTYGAENLRRWRVHWRVFFMPCAELWAYAHGSERIISHYLFSITRS